MGEDRTARSAAGGEGRVRRFRVAVRTPAPRGARLLEGVSCVALVALWVTAAFLDGRQVLWLLLLVPLVVLGVVGGRTGLGTDLTREGLRPRPGRRLVRWEDVRDVQPPGRWRDEAVARTSTGSEVRLLGVPEGEARDLATAVAGDADALSDVLARGDVLPDEGAASSPGPRLARAAWLRAAGVGVLATSVALPLLADGTPAQLGYVVLVVVALAMMLVGTWTTVVRRG